MQAEMPGLAAVLAAETLSQRTSKAPAIVDHRELRVVTRIRQDHAAVHELLAQGLSKAAIGRARAADTSFSTAWPRFCHRWKRSAT